jgi:hypothetical protein
MSEKTLRTVPETARERGISYRRLLQSIHTGDLNAVQFDGQRSYYLDPADVDAWIEAHKTRPETGTRTGTKRTAPNDKTGPNRTLVPYPSDWYVKK